MSNNRERETRKWLLFNKQEWLLNPLIKFTEEEIDAADERGFIATRCGIDCYLARPVEVFTSNFFIHGK